jgi:hypothetical protein
LKYFALKLFALSSSFEYTYYLYSNLLPLNRQKRQAPKPANTTLRTRHAPQPHGLENPIRILPAPHFLTQLMAVLFNGIPDAVIRVPHLATQSSSPQNSGTAIFLEVQRLSCFASPAPIMASCQLQTTVPWYSVREKLMLPSSRGHSDTRGRHRSGATRASYICRPTPPLVRSCAGTSSGRWTRPRRPAQKPWQTRVHLRRAAKDCGYRDREIRRVRRVGQDKGRPQGQAEVKVPRGHAAQ